VGYFGNGDSAISLIFNTQDEISGKGEVENVLGPFYSEQVRGRGEKFCRLFLSNRA
jgi:hypothetical protein